MLLRAQMLPSQNYFTIDHVRNQSSEGVTIRTEQTKGSEAVLHTHPHPQLRDQSKCVHVPYIAIIENAVPRMPTIVVVNIHHLLLVVDVHRLVGISPNISLVRFTDILGWKKKQRTHLRSAPKCSRVVRSYKGFKHEPWGTCCSRAGFKANWADEWHS